MPRPELSAPTHVVVSVLRNVPTWFEPHREALALELGAHPPHPARAAELGVALEEAEARWLLEQKEGQALTMRREAWVERVRVFVGAMKATLQLRFDAHPERARLLEAFRVSAPSSVRSIQMGTKVLQHLSANLKARAALVDQAGEPISALWGETLQNLLGEAHGLEAELHQEEQERQDAKAIRDELKAEGVGLLRHLDLAAESVSWREGAPLRALEVLFDTFYPDGPKARASEAEEPDDALT
jgi:hypothetical protein